MQADEDIPTPSDETLAAQSARGDAAALAELYARYFGPLYDFARHTCRDEAAAADVVQGAFERALTAWPRALPRSVKAWLFTVARRLCIDEYRGARRSLPLEVVEAVAVDDAMTSGALPDPVDSFQRRELEDLVWEAANGLPPDDYALLDLHLRQRLETNELAAELHLSRGALYTRLSRLKAALEQSVVVVLLLRHGRRACARLDSLAGRPGGALTRQTRQAIWGHLQACAICQQGRARFASPLDLFAALAPALPPPGLREAIWRRLDAAFHAQHGSRSVRGQPNAAMRGVVRRAFFSLGLLLIVAVWLALLAGHDPAVVFSLSHEIGRASDNHVIDVAWSPQPFTSAYAVLWSQGPLDLPDTRGAILLGRAVSTRSPALPDGAWYFHMRTRGWNGRWTSTVHLGPFFLVTPPAASPSPTSTRPAAPTGTPPNTLTLPPPSATASLTQTPTWTSTPSPSPTGTPTSTATPSVPLPTPTPLPTETAPPPPPPPEPSPTRGH